MEVAQERSIFETNRFNDFNVHSLNNIHSFFHIEISDTKSFYNKMFDYFFDESRLLKFAENKSNLTFEPTVVNFVTLYKLLGNYIDDFNIIKTAEEIDQELFKILELEYTLEKDSHGGLRVRLDKMGKIGEYLFCNLLSEYFNFDCIIPKVHLTTDPNMSVYGIDTLFYSVEDDLIMFGESKLSKSLVNGVGLINKSLLDYEQQIKDEFNLMLSNRFLKNNMGVFEQVYGDYSEVSLDILEFIEKAQIKKIGIPIFIAHGNEEIVENIITELSKIKQNNLFDLDTIYYLISLPIIDKDKLIATFTKGIKDRRDYFERAYAKL